MARRRTGTSDITFSITFSGDDSRKFLLDFISDALSDAVIKFDRKHQDWLWQQRIEMLRREYDKGIALDELAAKFHMPVDEVRKIVTDDPF
jgi:hypothetical protein